MYWKVNHSRLRKFTGKYWIIPCISIWYDRYYFLETGVETPAFGFQIAFLNYTYGITIQKSYY
jgi:hypothetical protein